MRILKQLTLFLSLVFVLPLTAGEGMWIPSLLKQLNEEEMIEMGFRLSAEDIYSVNHSSMKDAVVLFGRGCTGEIVSGQGLLLTNHHCGLGYIQRHSSVENDYLTNGFWAMNRKEEIPNPGLSVTLLKRMEDVTEEILKGMPENPDEVKRNEIIRENIDRVVKEKTEGTHYEAYVKPFFHGNTYYLFITEVFKDIRLVGAPPSSIGKFGGDTDNWMWPRHTGDFSIFRIYTGPDNKPAEYSEENIPYTPDYHFPISLEGYEKGDFTLVFGYPGSTDQFYTSDAVRLVTQTRNPIAIDARKLRLDIFDRHMRKDDQVRIQYTTKHARIANGWKKWIGENRGIRQLNTISEKIAWEESFQAWVDASNARQEKYGTLLTEFEEVYDAYIPATRSSTYIREAGLACELIRQSGRLDELLGMAYDESVEVELVREEADKMLQRMQSFYKDYNAPTDQDVFATLSVFYLENMDETFIPPYLKKLEKKFKGDREKMAEYVFEKTMLLDKEKLTGILKAGKRNKIKKFSNDPAYLISDQYREYYFDELIPVIRNSRNELDSLYRVYTKAIMEMQPDRRFYPDANLTLRVAYGQVDDYYPRDAVHYQHFTTLDGIFEKVAMGVYDYIVPEKLAELQEAEDYGRYADKDGELHTCFIASNHTTGGNSGSPVINADGQLIGINFDRNWEGTMSDIDYDPDMCRNISLDIRYCLFIIDKFAGASHLIEEMTIVE